MFAKMLRNALPPGSFERAGGVLGNAAGRVAQSYTGLPMAPIGSYLGAAAGRAIKGITGMGDYRVSENSLSQNGYALPPGEPVPAFGAGKLSGKTYRIQHREFIANLIVPANPTLFNSQTFAFDVSDPTVFPWFHRIAANYAAWRPHGAIVTFISNTSGYSAAGPLGSLAFASQYDVNAEDFSSMAEMLNSQFAVSAAPSCNQMHPIECNPAERPCEWLLTGAGPRAANASADMRFQQLCKVQVATEGLPGTAGQALGAVYVTFDIELDKPLNNQGVGQLIVGNSNGANELFRAGTSTGATYFWPTAQQRLKCMVAGDYLIQQAVTGTSPLLTQPVGTGISPGLTVWDGSNWVSNLVIMNAVVGKVYDWSGTTGTNMTPTFRIAPFDPTGAKTFAV